MQAGVYSLVAKNDISKIYYVNLRIFEEGSEAYNQAKQDFELLQEYAYSNGYQIIDRERDVFLPIKPNLGEKEENKKNNL